MSDGPNPSGLCMCGCGRPTPLARYNCKRDNLVAGAPIRFIKGHNAKTNANLAVARRRVNSESEARCLGRRSRVCRLYVEGVGVYLIARMCEVSVNVVMNDLKRARRDGVELPYRNRWSALDLTPKLVRQLEAEWRAGNTLIGMGARHGWSTYRVETVLRFLRRRGYSFPRRAGSSPELTTTTTRVREVVRTYRRQRADNPDLAERQKAVLRLLAAVGSPVSCRALCELYAALGHAVCNGSMRSVLLELRRKGLVERAESRWFIPFEAECSRESLTLADAERETELAALIREQEDDIDRGHWAKADGTVSLDAPFGDGGGTFHDILQARR